MQLAMTETQLAMAALVEAIEADADNSTPAAGEMRSEHREPLHVECELCLFESDSGPEVIADAIARNMTFLGLSVVAAIPEPVKPGRPVEAIVASPGGTQTHVAGTVVFCRKIDTECHEIGVSVLAVGRAPILIHDPDFAQIVYDWFAKAMRTPR